MVYGVSVRKRASALWLTWISVLIVIVDQVTKQQASSQLILYEPLPVTPYFNLTLMHNTGAAFSMLHQAGGWQRWLLAGMAMAISVVLVVWLRRLPRHQTWLGVALALILGGALGNLWDRLILGYVVDFIEVYYEQWYWPAFNIADSAIFVGAFMLLWDQIRAGREQTADNG